MLKTLVMDVTKKQYARAQPLGKSTRRESMSSSSVQMLKEEKLRNPHKKVELPAAPGDDFAAIPVIPVEVRELIADIQRQRPVRRACELQLIDMKLISKILVRHVSAGPDHALACSTGYQVFGWGDNNFG